MWRIKIEIVHIRVKDKMFYLGEAFFSCQITMLEKTQMKVENKMLEVETATVSFLYLLYV